MLRLVGMQHLGPGTHRVKGQATIGNLSSMVVIRGNGRWGHTLQHRVEVVVLTLRNFEMLITSSAINPINLHRVPTLLPVRVVISSPVHLQLVEELVGVQDVFHVDSLDTLQPTAHCMLLVFRTEANDIKAYCG